MRPARLPAACTLLVLTVGPVALATAPALAAESPSAAPSATATTSAAETPSPTPTPSVTPTGTGPTGTASPTGPSSECPEGTTEDPLPVTGRGSSGELAVTFTNDTTATAKQFAAAVALADGGSGLPLELRAGAGAWKPLTATGTPADAGTYQLPQGQKLTLTVRLAPGAPHGAHRLTFTARSEILPSGSAPARKYTCPRLTATYTGTLGPSADHSPTSTPAPAHLADTGAGTATRPLAIAGTTALVLGTGLLLLTRRRPTTD
ncbi:LPXTG cell wall anchor domain-containing protein [Kitasatospora sp. NPDC096077]|uniref:LPXTG cell wall anchor domain-containing protein n=1 Tax=Kitasatospora sp. NPDC096077 TaxID=3155544 RepID=UPI0033276D63